MKNGVKNLLLIFLALCIPALLILSGVQASRYSKLENEIRELENQQTELIEKNSQLISEISVLSSSERIEEIAVEKLGMKKAKSDEIVRVEVKGESK